MLDKNTVLTEVADLESELKKKRRLLEKLENANRQFQKEPEPGTVLKFERSIAGSTRKYTFVVLGVAPNSWTVTGKKNALRVIGLKESDNTWQDVVMAVGQETLYEATGWDVAGPHWHYYQGTETGKVYRSTERAGNAGGVDAERYSEVLQDWKSARAYGPNLRAISREEAVAIAGPKVVQ